MKRKAGKLGIRGIGGAVLAAGLLFSGSAGADPESCREWRMEHTRWKTRALKLYLRGAPQTELDSAVFEVLQREAYLTSCEVSVRHGRDDLVGWRLVGRLPDEYGSAVAESVLERAGFDLGLDEIFAARPQRVTKYSRRSPRGKRGVAAR
ncbi:MAG: hypothetical protein QNK04_04575 [Myxococcota bacterium]|nr:hypothetical protein [Myxococcota bacterium]